MEIKRFAAKVRNAVAEELGNGYRVEIKEVKKNNGVVLHGLLILSEGNNMAPTIYLDDFWEAYESGMVFAAIVRRLLAVYRENIPDGRIDMEFFRAFEKVKDRICYRLIGKKGNEEMLQEVPYLDFMDLAICFFYAYQGGRIGEGAILVHNSHLEMWGTSTAELLKLAQTNTPRLFPWECSSLEDILTEITGQNVNATASDDLLYGGSLFREMPMWVLSNTRRLQGAACMLYPGVLEAIASKLKRSLYILPSSIHEIVLLADTGQGRAKELGKMVEEVNSTQVAPEEVLSDSLYYYDFSSKKVKKIF